MLMSRVIQTLDEHSQALQELGICTQTQSIPSTGWGGFMDRLGRRQEIISMCLSLW